MRVRAAVAALSLLPLLAAGCPAPSKGDIKGRVSRVSDLRGLSAEIRIEEFSGQPTKRQPWVIISDQALVACVVGARYPDCTGE